MIYTENMLAAHFNVTTLTPYECAFNNVLVKGRKSYVGAKAVSIRVTENKKYGFAVRVTLDVDNHFRNVQWASLSDKEKLKIQEELLIG